MPGAIAEGLPRTTDRGRPAGQTLFPLYCKRQEKTYKYQWTGQKKYLKHHEICHTLLWRCELSLCSYEIPLLILPERLGHLSQ